MRGQTVIIHFPNSDTKSVKICEIVTGVVRGIQIPRNQIGEYGEKYVKDIPGIYFLIGEKDEVGKQKIYIGEAEYLFKRIKQHNSGKEFWNSVIVFYSDKENINKAHIKYLENYCYQQAKNSNKSNLENVVNPTQSKITLREEDFLLSIFDQIKLIISTLGINIFEKEEIKEENLYFCKIGEIEAKGIYGEEGITVLKGSTVSSKRSTYAKTGNKIFEKLKQNKIIGENNENYIFLEDYLFSSPSSAADLVTGRSSNGWIERKDKNGKTLDENIRKQI